MAQKGKDEDNNTHKSMQKDGEWSGEFSFWFFLVFFFFGPGSDCVIPDSSLHLFLFWPAEIKNKNNKILK